MGAFDQSEFDVRFEWGLKGLEVLLPDSDVIIIVDVLSFSTCVDVVTARGSAVYPYRWKDETAHRYAEEVGAALAGGRNNSGDGFSLSPASFINKNLPGKLVLPSPNGSTLSLATDSKTNICGCLRNAEAVAKFARQTGGKIAVIAAGEQWPDGSLRPAFEDLLGAGAIISFLRGSLSPESQSALSVFNDAKDYYGQIKMCSSGKELIERGFEEDVKIAAQFNASQNVPVMEAGAYTRGNLV
jgi:2-phosphosulfolactate phosphatase